tara:strand:- start:249 stop:1076 length:828 start_codon:yes stop_codon:yes gene_type:complete
MFETYVINLQKDINNFYKLKNELNLRGIQPKRFNAIYGKNIKNFEKYNNYLSPYCKTFCPKSLIGSGLSHYILLEKIYSNHTKNSKSKYSLILEDDAVPLFNSKIDIEKIIKKWPDDCDILVLFCQGWCKYKEGPKLIKGTRFMGSAAAYLVKHNSIPKINKHKIIHYIDVQRFNTTDIKTYVYNPKLFDVNNDESYNIDLSINQNTKINKYLTKQLSLNNINLVELLLFKIFRIPILDYELTSFDVLKIIFVILIIFFIIMLCKKYKYKYKWCK